MIMDIEQLVESYKKADGVIEEMTAQKEVVRQAIIDYLTENKLNGKKVKGWIVQKIEYWDYSEVPLSLAEAIGAVKTVRKIDTGKIKKIDDGTMDIPGKRRATRLRIEEDKR